MSLRSQLDDLRGASHKKKEVAQASLLFPAKDAADMDIDTILAIGRNGLASLVEVDSTFAVFEETLFSETIKNMERNLLTRDENEQLDSIVESFLLKLSAHILRPGALKTLEWLIRRFRINEFNKEKLIFTVLPYHDTPAFATVVGTLPLKGDTKWDFLLPVKNNSVPLTREALVARCISDSTLLAKLCEMIEIAARHHTLHSYLVTFFSCTVIDFINRSTMTEQNLRVLLPTTFAMLASEEVELRASAVMVMTEVARKVPLSKEVFTAVTDTLIQSTKRASKSTALLSLACLYTHADVRPLFKSKTVNTLLAPSWTAAIKEALTQFDLSAFIESLIVSFVAADSGLINELNEAEAFFTGVSISDESFSMILKRVTSVLKELGENVDKKTLRVLFKVLSHRNPDTLSSFLNSLLLDPSFLFIHEFILGFFKGTIYEPVADGSTTLFLSLTNSDDSVRLTGFKKLIALLEEPDASSQDLSFAPEAIVSALKSEGEAILSVILSFENLLDFAGKEEAIPALAKIATSLALSADVRTLALSHLFKAEVSKEQHIMLVQNAVIGYFLLTKETGDVWVSTVTMCKTASPYLRKLFDGVEALASELLQAETSSEDSGVLEKIIGNLQGRVFTLFAGNVTKFEEHDNVLKRFIAGLNAEYTPTRVVYLQVLIRTLALTSMSYVSKLAIAEAFIRHAAKGLSSSPSTAGSVKLGISKVYDAMERAFMVESFSAILKNLVPNVKSETSWWSQTNQQPTYESTLKTLFATVMMMPSSADFNQLTQRLFTEHLKDSALGFLASISTDEGINMTVRTATLHLMATYISSQAELDKKFCMDFQVLIPCLMIALSSHERLTGEHILKAIRKGALACLKSLKKSLSVILKLQSDKKAVQIQIYGSSNFYGNGSNHLKFLQPETTHRLVLALLATSEDILADPFFLEMQFWTRENVNSAKFELEKILTFLLSNIVAFPSMSGRARLLKVLTGVESALKAKVLFPLYDQYFAPSATHEDEEAAYQIKECLIKAFDTPSVVTLFASRSGRFFKCFLSILSSGSEIDIQNVLEIISPSWFALLSAVYQQSILSHLLNMTNHESKDLAQQAWKVMRNLRLSAEILVAIISDSRMSWSELQEPLAKRAKTSGSDIPVLYHLISVLELIESSGLISSKIDLIATLFDLLNALLVSNSDGILPSLEYLKQLVVSSVLNIIKSSKKSGQTFGENVLRVDLIVQCIRVTENPQTHNQALLLMAEIAEVYPESVLLNVIPVFTFMGANILRRDDNYSFQVIQSTLETIIPSLISRHKQKHRTLAAVKSEMKPVLEVFADSLLHIPKHRRLKLFHILVSTMGPTEFLDTIILTLMSKYAKKTKDDLNIGPGDDSDNLADFCISLASQFSALVQVKSFNSITLSIRQSLNGKEDVECGGVSLSALTVREVKYFKAAVLEWITAMLRSKVFSRRLNQEADDDLSRELQGYFETLTRMAIESSDTNAESLKYFKRRFFLILTAFTAVLTLESFLDGINVMLANQNSKIRSKAISLISEKVKSVDSDTAQKHADLFRNVHEKLVESLKHQGDLELQSLIHSSLDCLNAFVIKFGAVYHAEDLALLKAFATNNMFSHQNAEMRRRVLICFTSLCQELGPRVVPYLNKAMESCMAILLGSQTQASKNFSIEEVICATTCLETLTTTLPQFLSPFIPQIIEYLISSAESDEPGSHSDGKIMALRREVTTNVSKLSPRILLPALVSHLPLATKGGPTAIICLFEIFSLVISNMDKAQLGPHIKECLKIFLTMFNFRKQSSSDVNEKDIDRVEECMISAFLQLVMRLNENLFKVLYFKLLDWSSFKNGEKDSSYHEHAIFLRIVDSLLARLKSIYVPYFIHTLEDTVTLLNVYNSSSKPDLRWKYLIQALNKFFLYAGGDVKISKETFQALTVALTEQFDMLSEAGNAAKYADAKGIVSCLGEMAVFGAEESLWKVLNKAVLNKSKSLHSQVRILSLKTLQEFYLRVGEDFLVLLPETIPSLAEYMEDNDEQVQGACQELAAEIQKHLGEDLSSFF
ncbi:HEAT repeat-containing protein 1 [Blyttiomyces sp. JEL0837]|nr:HEAT repeat-containing protein 1 [Blyttiomyces sp. JEL0837]